MCSGQRERHFNGLLFQARDAECLSDVPVRGNSDRKQCMCTEIKLCYAGDCVYPTTPSTCANCGTKF